MVGEIILAVVIIGGILYVHKVGLPKITQELKDTRNTISTAIDRHAFTSARTNRPNPVPLARTDTGQTPVDMIRASSQVAPGPDKQEG